MSENSHDSSPRINRLSLQLANQIAAGEVVERPASVVKELMENSLDAGSNSIQVDIFQGGVGLIRVRDNGSGINKKDMHLAVSRHATSKLHNLNELENILSLGFRGEALASISSVSRLALHSKSHAENSKAWCIDTGNDSDFANYRAELMPSSLPNGTMLEVRDLFFNTPARRKFLRSEKTEFRYIDDVFKRIAMSFYDVSFQLTHNKKLIRKLPAVQQAGKLKRLEKLFGSEFCQAAMPIDFNSQELQDIGSIKLNGWVADPKYLKHQANQQYFYVNGRFVRDKLLNHAIRQVFQELIPSDMHAAYVLYLQIDPGQIDVNVHPTKHEVRFRHARMIHDFIISALTQAISPQFVDSVEISPVGDNTLAFEEQKKHYWQRNETPTRSQIRDNLSSYNKLYRANEGSSVSKEYHASNNSDFNQMSVARSHELDAPATYMNSSQSDITIGQPLSIINERFFIAEIKNELWLVDLVKCLPVINRLRLKNGLKTGEKLATQRLLIPECILLDTHALELLLKYQAVVARFGLQYTPAGPDSIMLREVAKLPFKINFKLMFKQLLECLSQNKDSDLDKIFENQLVDCLSGPIDMAIVNEFKPASKQLILHSIANESEQKLFEAAYVRLNCQDLEKILLSYQ